ncbi:hypothetical protein SBDP1_130039 [Syntrophobacter sp. SbD1]|nr:hypothetical protein SBDP1_130039 [Syntrophobacter sp. SbD1]
MAASAVLLKAHSHRDVRERLVHIRSMGGFFRATTTRWEVPAAGIQVQAAKRGEVPAAWIQVPAAWIEVTICLGGEKTPAHKN